MTQVRRVDAKDEDVARLQEMGIAVEVDPVTGRLQMKPTAAAAATN